MKSVIIKTNEWYDNLPEGKRFLFFLVVIMGTSIVTQYLMICQKFFWAFPIWVIVFCFWRIVYVFFDWRDKYKKIKKKEKMLVYNSIPHQKINSEKSPNELIRNLIKIQQQKDREIVEKLIGIELLTEYLATKSEAELSRVLNVIVRETKMAKSKLEK